jgi:streptomycin 6-kinase
VTIDAIARYLDVWQLVPEDEPFETHAAWLIYARRGSTPAVLKVPKGPNIE